MAKILKRTNRSYSRQDKNTLILLKLLSKSIAEAEKGKVTEQKIVFQRLKKIAP